MILRKLRTSMAVCLAGITLMTSVAFAQINVVNKDSVNVRKAASSNASIMGQLNANEKVEVYENRDGWKRITYGNETAWVNEQFLTPVSGGSTVSRGNDGTNVTIKVDDVNLRSGPGTDYGIKDTLSAGTKLTLVSSNGRWSNVKTSGGTVGYVLTEFISGKGQASTSKSTPKVTKTNSSRGSEDTGARNSDVRSRIVSTALRQVGAPYVYGGTTPNGFDCSGFVGYVFSAYGVNLERVAADQARQGTKVSRSDLRAGDLIFFDTDGGLNYINHVGIYIGGGDFVHASSGRGSVMVSNLNGGFYSDCVMTCRNVLN